MRTSGVRNFKKDGRRVYCVHQINKLNRLPTFEMHIRHLQDHITRNTKTDDSIALTKRNEEVDIFGTGRAYTPSAAPIKVPVDLVNPSKTPLLYPCRLIQPRLRSQEA